MENTLYINHHLDCPFIIKNISSKNEPAKRKRTAYDAAFKLKVIERAGASNNSVASREFNAHEKQVRKWRKNSIQLGFLRVGLYV